MTGSISSYKLRPIAVIQFQSFRNWIIDGILRESLAAIKKDADFYFFPDSRKSVLKRLHTKFQIKNRGYQRLVYGNHKTYLEFNLERNSNSDSRVFVTQILDHDFSLQKAPANKLTRVERFVVQNKQVYNYLMELGVDKSRIRLNPGGINRHIFYPLPSSTDIQDFILISGSFKQRKNPQLISKIIRSFPKVKFLIHGTNFDVFPTDLGDNVEFLDFDFRRQPELMRSARLHLMVSKMEGGPMSILEALASGTPCVVTDVGFCQEIVDSNSGVILQKEPTISEIRSAIDFAWSLKQQVYNRDLLNGKFTWMNFGEDLFL